tara:strand:- start:25348 stop:26208 length:861 start_codon:yes stop_codon:yes gene_type:complete
MPRFISSIDPTIGHSPTCWPTALGVPSPLSPGIGVTIEGRYPVIVGDVYNLHSNGCGPVLPHPPIVVVGSPDVFIGNSPVLRDGDPLSCGDVANTLIPSKVFINGDGLGGTTTDPGQTRGFILGKPVITYPTKTIDYRAVFDEGGNYQRFLGGCHVSIKPTIYTPLTEEGGGATFRNYPGSPITEQEGAPDLPSYAPPFYRRPIRLTDFKVFANPRGFMEEITNGSILPGISINYNTGEISGSYIQINPQEQPPEQVNIRVSISNVFGTTEHSFNLRLISVVRCQS